MRCTGKGGGVPHENLRKYTEFRKELTTRGKHGKHTEHREEFTLRDNPRKACGAPQGARALL